MDISQYIFLFIIGTIFGSFWSVLLRRLQYGFSWTQIKGILYGRSECPGCHKILTVGQLIPFRWRLRQRGQCFRCKKPISSIYPILELVSWLIFIWWGLWIADYGLWITNVLLLISRWLLGLLLVWDIYTYELHMPVFFFLVMTSLILLFLNYSVSLLLYPLLFGIVFIGIYYFGQWYSKIRFWIIQETFGQWDVLLAPVLWLLLILSLWDNLISLEESIMMLLYFIVWSCLLGLLYYGIRSVIYSLFSKQHISDSFIHQDSPIIPFLPAMIVCYRLMIYLMR